VEGSSCDLEVLPRNLLGGSDGNHITPLRIAGVHAEIITKNFLNTNLDENIYYDNLVNI
jgi:hypothetical protein